MDSDIDIEQTEYLICNPTPCRVESDHRFQPIDVVKTVSGFVFEILECGRCNKRKV